MLPHRDCIHVAHFINTQNSANAQRSGRQVAAYVQRVSHHHAAVPSARRKHGNEVKYSCPLIIQGSSADTDNKNEAILSLRLRKKVEEGKKKVFGKRPDKMLWRKVKRFKTEVPLVFPRETIVYGIVPIAVIVTLYVRGKGEETGG